MLSAGIVGLPNVGKSTLFNAVTRTRKAEAANYPFCTIEPNQGIVSVPDSRLEALAKLSKSSRIIPAAIEFVDIAGLVKGASKGEGLGNQFLSHIREVDAVVQVVRCFQSSDIHHVGGSIDPIRDIEVINTELLLADLGSLQKRSERLQKQIRTGDKQAKAEGALLERLIPHMNSGQPAITLESSAEERSLLGSFFLLTGKPTILACNVAESDLAGVLGGGTGGVAAKHVATVSSYARTHLAIEAVVISAQIESELVDLSAEEAAEYLQVLE
jgi:ribosome-binding ATPase